MPPPCGLTVSQMPELLSIGFDAKPTTDQTAPQPTCARAHWPATPTAASPLRRPIAHASRHGLIAPLRPAFGSDRISRSATPTRRPASARQRPLRHPLKTRLKKDRLTVESWSGAFPLEATTLQRPREGASFLELRQPQFRPIYVHHPQQI